MIYRQLTLKGKRVEIHVEAINPTSVGEHESNYSVDQI